MKVRRCTINLGSRTTTLDPEGIWVPWEDHEASVTEIEKRIEELAGSGLGVWEEETENLRGENAAMERALVGAEKELKKSDAKIEDLKRKLASARSQLSRAKKKRATEAV